MRLNILLISGLIFICISLKGQTQITGLVTDSLNNPIPFASVYLSKTTIGSLTDKEGIYSLTINQSGVYEMIASCMGYKPYSQIITVNNNKLIVNIKLSVNLILLKEVTVKSKDKNRLTNYTQFVKLFFGESSNSQKCKILNPEDLHLYRDYENNLLKGFSTKPLQIQNNSLGYLIIYYLTDFQFNLKTGFLKFNGNHYFQDLIGNKRKVKLWNHNRLEAYYGSRMHLLRSLYSNSLIQENFKISECKLDPVNKKNIYFNPITENNIRVSQSSGYVNIYDPYIISIQFTDNHPELATGILGFQPQQKNSTLEFLDTLKVYQNGFYDNPYFVTWEGAMANERVADMLPFDFLPNASSMQTKESSIITTPIEEYLLSQQKITSPDEVFVHLDRNMYKSGDTIYFQAYIRDRFTTDFESKSISMYALLYDHKQTMVDSSRFKIDRSISSGWMKIPADVETGIYHFVAFTSMMQNYDPSEAFQIDLFVIGKGNTTEKNYPTINKNDNHLIDSVKTENQFTELRFLPEGGTLVSGLPQRIGFNATNLKGKSVYIEGLLRNNKGKVIDKIRSGIYGPGLFVCSPEPGMFVEITKGAEKEKIWPLPDPTDNEICLSVKQINDRSFAIEIKTDNYRGEKVIVSGVMNMTQILSQELLLDKERRIVVKTDQLPSGIAQITLFNAEMRPVAERLIYLNADKHLKFNIKSGSKVYSPGQETELSVSVTDGQGNPEEGIFSISVVDSISGHDPKIFVPDIEYSFNYHPYFYANLPPKVIFEGLENLTAEDRDLLLMVYGWSKYNWDFSTKVKLDSTLVNFDIIKMKILYPSKRQATNSGLDLVSLEGPSIKHLLTDKYGEISLPLDSLPEITRSVTIMPNLKDRKKMNQAMLSIPSNEQYFHNHKFFIQHPTVPLESYFIPPANWNDLQIEGMIELPEVNITSHKKYQNIYEERYKNANISSLESKELRNSFSLDDALHKIHIRSGITSIFGTNNPPLIVLDGMPLYYDGGNIVKTILPSDISSLTVLNGRNGFTFYGEAALNGVIFINTFAKNPSLMQVRTDWKLQNSKNNILTPIKLYRANVDFYNPSRVELDNNPVFQKRSTVYWESEVYFNGRDPVRIKYTNLKHIGPVIIRINGASKNNLVGTGRSGYMLYEKGK